MRRAAERLDAAVRDEGQHPVYHRRQIARLRREWPALWASVEDVQAALKASSR